MSDLTPRRRYVVTSSRCWRAVAVTFFAALFGAACNDGSRGKGPLGESTAVVTASADSSASLPAKTKNAKTHSAAARGDADKGEALMVQMQCARCHDSAPAYAAPAGDGAAAEAGAGGEDDKHCVKCHVDVVGGRFKDHKEWASWRDNVEPLTVTPSLKSTERFSYGWLVSYLQAPTDLRPHMVANMPRLRLSEEQARDVATFLTKSAAPRDDVSLEGADLARGRKLLESKQCGTCHAFSGVPALTDKPNPSEPASRLAPDLRYARERLDAATVLAWLADPLKVKSDTKMPQTEMTEAERKDLAAYILSAKLAPRDKVDVKMPALLDREVGYKEVAEKLFGVTCVHCHGDPDKARGDGGPGNSGGFGFPPRALNLTSYKRTMAGYKDDEGERHSVFMKTADGTPRIVESLLARYREENGDPTGEVRGMPLGFPPVPMEDIALLATWISQGRKK